MIELGVIAMRPMEDFKVSYIFDSLESQENHLLIFGLLRFSFFFQTEKSAIGSKHCFLFNGEIFDQKEEFKMLKSYFLGTLPFSPLVSRATS